MKVYIFFNKQRKREDGTYPIYIVVSRPPKRLYIHTGLFTGVEFTDGIFPRSERNHKAKTILLSEYLEKTERIAIENSLLPHDELKAMIQDRVFGKSTINKSLVEYIREYGKKSRSPRTQELYERTALKLEKYGKPSNLNISVGWLEDFLQWMRCCGLRDNSSSIHLRNIRSVFNDAIRHDITDNYPFRLFHIPQEQTRKRNIPLEDLRFLIDCTDLSPRITVYRDIFVLMFYLIGINMVDLFNARQSDLVDGRLEYKRFKTGRLYSIKVEPEAMSIIDKYRGKTKLIGLFENDTCKNFITKIDRHLKSIIPGISTYYSRHTWASIASQIDIPVDTISAALGHENGMSVTNIYIKYDTKKIDDANRKVIDFVLGLNAESGQD